MVQNGAQKRIAVLMLAVVLFLSAMPCALAMTEVEWNRSCFSKTGGTTTIYEQITILQEDQSNGTEFIWPQYEYRPIGSLPANTYVKVYTRGDHGYQKISYLKGGSEIFCYIQLKPYPLVKAAEYVQCVQESNSMICVTEVAEAYLNDKDALRKYIRTAFPGYRLLEDHEKDNLVSGRGDSLFLSNSNSSNGNSNPPSSSKPVASSTGSKKTTSSPKETVAVRCGENTVQLVRLGVATSTVLLNGEEKNAPTTELDFGSKAEKNRQIAVIHAPKSGTCTLRAKASDSGKALQKCKAGTVVMVLETGAQWSKISYKDTVGYVLTGCLKWYDAQTEGTGLLSYNGRTTGSTTINVRNAPSGDSAKIAEWPTGTEVEVFGLENGWYEIEYKGIHGFVMEKFLTVQQ